MSDTIEHRPKPSAESLIWLSIGIQLLPAVSFTIGSLAGQWWGWAAVSIAAAALTRIGWIVFK